MVIAISAAAATHLILLSLLMLADKRYFSALKIAAWWRHIADVWMFMFKKITLGSGRPPGSLRCSGSPREVLSKIFSNFR
jgi:hypothetical protein